MVVSSTRVNQRDKMIAKAKLMEARISFKNSKIVCRAVKGKNVRKAMSFLEGLVKGEREIEGKHYTKAAGKIMEVLKNAIANAKQKGMKEERLFIKNIRVEKGRTFVRPRTLWNLRGQKAKSTNIYVEVEER